jgi:hypothetical protein
VEKESKRILDQHGAPLSSGTTSQQSVGLREKPNGSSDSVLPGELADRNAGFAFFEDRDDL